MWTLFYEAAAYAVIGVVLSFGLVRRHPRITGVVLVIAATAVSAGRGLIDTMGALGHTVAFGVWLAPYFAAGFLVWSLRGVLCPSWGGVSASLALLFGLIAMGRAEVTTLLAPLPLAVLLLMLGQLLPVRIGSTNDVSYGIYIYAFPVQQLLAVAVLQDHMGPLALAATALVITAVLAGASWLLVEKPSLRAKDWVRAPARSAAVR